MNASLQTRSTSRLLTATLLLAGIVVVSFASSAGVHTGEAHGACLAAVVQDSACPEAPYASLTFHAGALAKYFVAASSVAVALLLAIVLFGVWLLRRFQPNSDRIQLSIARFLPEDPLRPPPLLKLWRWLARLELSPNQN